MSIFSSVIPRAAAGRLHALSRQFPALLIVGPRQCGKTTFARAAIAGQYFDLERPSDFEVFAGDPELALERLEQPLVIDEAQLLPPLFSVLRPIIDAQRDRAGRFYLLGSVSPGLVRDVSESLAGRVATIELTPFLYREVAENGLGLEELWLRGAFPDAFLEEEEDRRVDWYEQYAGALVHRDLSAFDLRTSPSELRRFLGMLAHVHGGVLNASQLARSLGVSYHTINRYLDILEGHFLARRLQPWHSNRGKRLVKAPRIYLRDSGLLHSLLGVRSHRQLLESPQRGASWEGFLVEQIVALENLSRTGSQLWFYRTHGGAEVDLIVDRGLRRIGFELKLSSAATRGDARHLVAAIHEGVITSGYLIYAGGRRYPLTEEVEAVPASDLITDYATLAAD